MFLLDGATSGTNIFSVKMFWMIAALLVLAGGIAFGVAVGVHRVDATSHSHPTTTVCLTYACNP